MKKVALLFAALLAYTGLAFAVVNINSATQEQLATLDGIGPVKAQAIIDYRKKNGPFKKIEDIKKVDGIGDATFNAIKKDLVLSGTTTGAGKPAEKKADDKKAADPKKADDKKAADAKKPDDKKAADPKKADDKKAADAKKADDKKAADAKKADEKKK